MSLSINGKTIKSLMKDGKEIVKVERVEDGKVLYEKESNYTIATFTGNKITLEPNNWQWLESVGNVVIGWGDGSTDTVNNPRGPFTHTYIDGEQSHSIVFIGKVKSFGRSCFYDCRGLTSIIISNGVTSLGLACFAYCTSLTSVVIPNSVTRIEESCFEGCTSLTSVTIPDGVVSIGDYCFYNCRSLVDYQLYWTGNNIITYNSNKMPNNSNTVFTIPNGETANYVAKGYPSAKLQEREAEFLIANVTGNSIRLGYFSNLWLGTSGDVIIDWDDGTSDTVNNPTTPLTHNYTDGQQSHNIEFIGEVTGLGNNCFRECTNLTSINIPLSITSFGNNCFSGCTGLTSVTIPNSVTSLGKWCFDHCTGLTSVTIPNSVTSLGDGCFYGCTSLNTYQLYWTGNNIITYNTDNMPNQGSTKFYIPKGQKTNYTNKGYPSAKLVERS